LRRALELWPYVFVVVSIAGLAYIALITARWGTTGLPFSEGQAYTPVRV